MKLSFVFALCERCSSSLFAIRFHSSCTKHFIWSFVLAVVLLCTHRTVCPVASHSPLVASFCIRFDLLFIFIFLRSFSFQNKCFSRRMFSLSLLFPLSLSLSHTHFWFYRMHTCYSSIHAFCGINLWGHNWLSVLFFCFVPSFLNGRVLSVVYLFFYKFSSDDSLWGLRMKYWILVCRMFSSVCLFRMSPLHNANYSPTSLGHKWPNTWIFDDTLYFTVISFDSNKKKKPKRRETKKTI